MGEFATEGVATVNERRHILVGDLDALEHAIADYVAKWGEHLTGQPYQGEFGTNLAGIPCAVANMAMTVIRKNLITSWTEPVLIDTGAMDRELQAKAQEARTHACSTCGGRGLVSYSGRGSDGPDPCPDCTDSSGVAAPTDPGAEETT